MSQKNYTVQEKGSPSTIEKIEQKIRDKVENIIAFSKEGKDEETVFSFEKLGKLKNTYYKILQHQA